MRSSFSSNALIAFALVTYLAAAILQSSFVSETKIDSLVLKLYLTLIPGGTIFNVIAICFQAIAIAFLWFDQRHGALLFTSLALILCGVAFSGLIYWNADESAISSLLMFSLGPMYMTAVLLVRLSLRDN